MERRIVTSNPRGVELEGFLDVERDELRRSAAPNPKQQERPGREAPASLDVSIGSSNR